MITQQSQIKINLSTTLKDYLESKAQKFDIPITSYIRHLILKDVSDMEFPVYKISEVSGNKAKKALTERNKAIRVKNVSTYFKNL